MSIISRVRVRGRVSDHFSSSFHAKTNPNGGLSPRLLEPKATTPRAEGQPGNLQKFESVSEDTGDFERASENANGVTSQNDSDELSLQKGKDSSNDSKQTKPKKCKKIVKSKVKYSSEKVIQLKNIGPALEKYKLEKATKGNTRASEGESSVTPKSGTPPNNNSQNIRRPNREHVQKKKVKNFMIRNTKKYNSANKDMKKKATVTSTDYGYKRSQSTLDVKPGKIYEENPFENLGKKRNSLMGNSTNYARYATFIILVWFKISNFTQIYFLS